MRPGSQADYIQLTAGCRMAAGGYLRGPRKGSIRVRPRSRQKYTGGKDEYPQLLCRSAHHGRDYGPGRGCTSAGGNAALTSAFPKPEEPDITIAAIPAVDLAGLYIAQDEGLFARQGLHVTIEKIPSSQAIIAGQLKGQIDISAGSYVAYISAQAGWVAWA